MAWGNWQSKQSSLNGDGSCYVIYYRTNPYSAAGQAQIEYYVQVHETGDTYSQRWNCVVELTVDGSTTTGTSHSVDYVGTSENANKYSTVKKNGEYISGYYKGYVCIPHKSWQNGTSVVSTKNISNGVASWTFSLKGGFRSTANRNCVINSFTVSANGYTEVGTGTTTITDNYNNTFKISATKGANGTNNTAGGPDTLKWGYDTNYSNTYTNGGSNTLTISGTGKTRRVYAKSRTTATYGNAKESTTYKDIRQYVGPNAVTGHKLTYSKSRLTVKEDWGISWTAPGINNECPIKGYRIRLYRKRGSGSFIKLPIFASNGSYLSTKVVSSGDIYYDTEKTTTSLTLYPKYYSSDLKESGADIQAGDTIKFSVMAYTKYGQNNDGSILFKTNLAEQFSGEFVVQNAGVMYVYNGGSWEEGQVYVYNGSTWEEAEVVNVHTGSTWEEAE